ncbi:hypothetical protein [Xanthomonas oryzae]|uniref:hypothetical protein n=1 Tax=Xanthomonas oryzae TaxID=347 RepID=UPI00118770D2|nr:hypothetical protein [Xanthomonas oryzae]
MNPVYNRPLKSPIAEKNTILLGAHSCQKYELVQIFFHAPSAKAPSSNNQPKMAPTTADTTYLDRKRDHFQSTIITTGQPTRDPTIADIKPAKIIAPITPFPLNLSPFSIKNRKKK